MYFVDREKIESILVYLESLITLLQENKGWKQPILKLALERIGHLIIESILDVGNSMIDGFIMRDPGSYEDIIDILEDEKVIRKDQADSLKKVISFRKLLVQEYISVNHDNLAKTFLEELDSIKSFPNDVRTYLQNELGPVSAFKS
ncbi:DUF86 domain-containing protein [Bacillus sp. DJP31]|uniref:DUF86 domain-containing protein n=1 Tax=Bacillus sp. DJP31 TaxID=3409789 RepID=UPI003BB66CFF